MTTKETEFVEQMMGAVAEMRQQIRKLTHGVALLKIAVDKLSVCLDVPPPVTTNELRRVLGNLPDWLETWEGDYETGPDPR